MLVVDASVVATAIADDAAAGDVARDRLRGEDLIAPELVDLEVASALRGLLLGGHLSLRRAQRALADLADLPLRRVTHRGLLPRCWDLRDNLTMYDAVYVALAEVADAVVLTADRRLARATGPRCPIELLAPN